MNNIKNFQNKSKTKHLQENIKFIKYSDNMILMAMDLCR